MWIENVVIPKVE